MFGWYKGASQSSALSSSLAQVTGEIFKQYRNRNRRGVDNELKKKLNRIWKVSWSAKQWTYRFQCLWAFPTASKHSFLLWLLIHQGIWTSVRALKAGKGSGFCARCKTQLEDCTHLWFYCKHNKKVLDFLNSVFLNICNKPMELQDLLLGNCKGLDVPLWNIWRGIIVWFIWNQRNDAVFQNASSPPFSLLMYDLQQASYRCCKLVSDAFPSDNLSIPSPENQQMAELE